MNDELTEATLLLVALGAGIVAFETLRRRSARFDFLFFFNVSFLVYFVLAPLHMFIGGMDYATLPNVYRDYFMDAAAGPRMLWMASLVAVAYLGTVGGYWVKVARARRASDGVALLYEGISTRQVRAVIWICLIVGSATLGAYVLQFDSPATAFLQAGFIRTGDEAIPGALAFLQKFVPLIAVAAPLYAATCLRERNSRLTKGQVARVFALTVLGLLALTTQGSRRVWMIFALEFYFLFANWRERTYLPTIFALLLFGGVIVLFGDFLSTALALGPQAAMLGASQMNSELAGTLYAAAWRDFTYPFQAAVAIVDRYGEFPRLFVDVPLTLVQFIPERVIPIPMPEAIETHSTLLIAQVPVPLINEVPPGYVGFFWYSGYLPGVLIGTVAYGYLGRVFEGFLLPAAQRSAPVMLVYAWAAFFWGYWLREGSLYMLMIERMGWIVAAMLMLILGRVTFVSRRRDAAATVAAS